MSDIRNHIKNFDSASDELRKLATIEAAAQADLAAVLEDGKIESEKEQQKLANARLRLDLCPSRVKRNTELRAETFGDALREYEAARRAHNREVKAARAAKLEEVERALLPFYDGRERQVQKLVATLEIPAAREISKFADQSECSRESPEFIIDNIRRFLAQRQRFLRFLGRATSDAAEA